MRKVSLSFVHGLSMDPKIKDKERISRELRTYMAEDFWDRLEVGPCGVGWTSEVDQWEATERN